VIGLGVGYAYACSLAEAGYEVVGIDINPDVVKNPRRDASVTRLLEDSNRMRKIREHLILTTDYDKILGSSLVIICVSTGDEKQLILGNVEQAVKTCINILKDKNASSTILVHSTLPFGSSKRIKEIFQELGVQIDRSIGYCYMPQMIAQGTTADNFVNQPFAAFGSYNPETAEKTMRFYTDFIQKSCLFNGKVPPIYVVTPEIAELAKLVANAFLSTKISFANMVSYFCEENHLDGKKLLEIVGSDWRIGSAMFKVGYAFGGACFPRDLMSLIETFEVEKISCPLLQATDEVNQKRIIDPIRVLHANKLNGKVLLLGLAYKAGITDYRGSPSLHLFEALKKEKYDVETYDPNFYPNKRLNEVLKDITSNIVVVTTPEQEFKSLGHLIKGTEVHTILDYADIVNVKEIPPGVRLYKAGKGWCTNNRQDEFF